MEICNTGGDQSAPRTSSVLLIAGLLTLGFPSSLNAETRPNIVIIMADDMGYSDIGCFGGEIKTPNIDRLASNGVRFTQFYNAGKCCPTRAALLTGVYPHQAGIGWMVSADLGRPGYRGDLSRDCVTIAEVLREAGYKCYMAGKWHVTPWNYQANDGPKHNWPLERGFHHCYATINGSGNYFNFGSLVRDAKRIRPNAGYYTDAISDEAAEYVRSHASESPGSPFFMYVAYTAPHFPLHAKRADIAKYLGSYHAGWEAVRARRFSRMQELGISNEGWSLSPIDASDWSQMSDDEKLLWDKRMAVYAAQIDCMDQGIGRIVKSLAEAGAERNTLVMFLSDNGGCAELKSRSDASLAALGTRRSYESYRREWANVSNTPFRLYKRYAHEGGIAAPLIACWPYRIKPRDDVIRTPAHVIDLMATCVDAADTTFPERFAGREVTQPEGTSLLPLFAGDSIVRTAPLCWEYEGNRAIRDGKWKLVSRGLLEAWELYDLSRDRCELNNVVSRFPGRVERLSSAWNAWAERTGVLPIDGRTKDARLSSASQ